MSVSNKTQAVVKLFENHVYRDVKRHIAHNWDNPELGFSVVEGEDINTEKYEAYAYMADRRTLEELVEELIRGWLIEDIFKMKLDADLVGSGCNRDISESTNNITCDPDLEIEGEKVEVLADFGEYWKQNQTLELRSYKWEHLDQDTELICLDVENGEYMRFEKNEVEDVEYIDSYGAYGGKSVYSLDISKFEFKSL